MKKTDIFKEIGILAGLLMLTGLHESFSEKLKFTTYDT